MAGAAWLRHPVPLQQELLREVVCGSQSQREHRNSSGCSCKRHHECGNKGKAAVAEPAATSAMAATTTLLVPKCASRATPPRCCGGGQLLLSNEAKLPPRPCREPEHPLPCGRLHSVPSPQQAELLAAAKNTSDSGCRSRCRASGSSCTGR